MLDWNLTLKLQRKDYIHFIKNVIFEIYLFVNYGVCDLFYDFRDDFKVKIFLFLNNFHHQIMKFV